MNYPLDRDTLCARTEAGEVFDYFFFYGHKPPESGVDSSCLSQWFARGFEVEGKYYPTAEHFMMVGKAKLFGDHEIAGQIPEVETPREAKALGRKVIGFDKDVWSEHCIQIVTEGNLAKFEQNPDLFEFLKSTAGTILVEAAGRDVIWGIGLGKK